MKKVTVSAAALRKVLNALNGPGYYIRELQVTRGPLIGGDNPINILCDEYNAAVEAHNEARKVGKGTVFEDRNMNVTREMPKYKCHKEVWALKIAGIVGDQHGGVYFQPAEEGYDKVPLSPEYVAKHKPEVGGYYVVYEDGYKSFSPADAFESGYTPL